MVGMVCFVLFGQMFTDAQTPEPISSASPPVTPTPTPELSATPAPPPTPAATSRPTPVPEPSPIAWVNEADLIHFGDVIDVDVLGGFEYDWRGALTTEGSLDGLRTFDEPVYGLCRSEKDVAADIVKAYSKTLRDPQVIVKIVDRSGRAVVRMDGAIKTPTRFRLQREVHLKELIVAAGGLTDEASGEISIFRPANLSCPESNARQDNAIHTINITISDLLAGKEAADPLILSGDLITVGKAVPIYVIGAVNNPRPIFARAGMTLMRAIATAGGLAKGAMEQKVTIFRREGGDSSSIHADLSKIKIGESGDMELRAFDIIEVAFKGGATRKYPPAIVLADKRGQNGAELPLKIIDK